VLCPRCGKGYRIASRLLGRRLICRHCKSEWRATEASVDELRTQRTPKPEPPSDSARTNLLPEDLPPVAGSSSTVIDTRWIGKRLGRYKILSILGKGGMGVVWRGHDEKLRRDVALKILTRYGQNRPGRDGLSAQLFMQEARAVAKLQHPSVVSIFEVAEDHGQVFLALELMEGGTLKEHVDRNGSIAPRDLASLMIGPTRALALAHRRGIIHRDIKPGNLMFDDHGHLKLMDFGLAHVEQEDVSRRMKGRAVGSLGWIAPETARGEGTTTASDIYGMGLVMLYTITARQWLHAKSRSTLIKLHQNPPQPDLKGIEGLDATFAGIISQCLENDQKQRYESADALADALEQYVQEQRDLERRRRQPRVAAAVLVAAVSLFVGIGGTLYFFLELSAREDKLKQPSIIPGSFAGNEAAEPDDANVQQDAADVGTVERQPDAPPSLAGDRNEPDAATQPGAHLANEFESPVAMDPSDEQNAAKSGRLSDRVSFKPKGSAAADNASDNKKPGDGDSEMLAGPNPDDDL